MDAQVFNCIICREELVRYLGELGLVADEDDQTTSTISCWSILSDYVIALRGLATVGGSEFGFLDCCHIDVMIVEEGG